MRDFLGKGQEKATHRPSEITIGKSHKLKGNSFYGNMTVDLEKNGNIKFTTSTENFEKDFQSLLMETK